MGAIDFPCSNGEVDRQKEKQYQTHECENTPNRDRVEQGACADGNAKGPHEIAGTRAKTNRPGGPESPTAVLRQQTAPDHFGINRSWRPGNRPAENVTVCQGAELHRFT